MKTTSSKRVLAPVMAKMAKIVPALVSGWLGVALLLAAVGTGRAQRRPTFPTLPVVLTVAALEGAPVVDDAWLDTQVENANTLFSPHGVRFAVAERVAMPEAHARLESRRDRHALGRRMHPGHIDWFVVSSLRDVDDPSRYRQGVHWRPRGVGAPDGAHFVITSSIAGPTVLAHELGHYFGNGHSDVPGNIMSYERGDGPPFFDADQVRRIHARLRGFLDAGELTGAPRPR